jgi:hypothetical protein
MALASFLGHWSSLVANWGAWEAMPTGLNRLPAPTHLRKRAPDRPIPLPRDERGESQGELSVGCAMAEAQAWPGPVRRDTRRFPRRSRTARRHRWPTHGRYRQIPATIGPGECSRARFGGDGIPWRSPRGNSLPPRAERLWFCVVTRPCPPTNRSYRCPAAARRSVERQRMPSQQPREAPPWVGSARNRRKIRHNRQSLPNPNTVQLIL